MLNVNQLIQTSENQNPTNGSSFLNSKVYTFPYPVFKFQQETLINRICCWFKWSSFTELDFDRYIHLHSAHRWNVWLFGRRILVGKKLPYVVCVCIELPPSPLEYILTRILAFLWESPVSHVTLASFPANQTACVDSMVWVCVAVSSIHDSVRRENWQWNKHECVITGHIKANTCTVKLH